MMPQHNNNLRPIDRLRQQKRVLKVECKRQEDVLAGHWDFLNDNVGILLFNSAISSFRRRMGFGPSKKEEMREDENLEESGFASSIGLGQKFVSGFMASAPVIWDLVQPLIMNAAINKVKSFFTRSEDEDYDYDDEEYEQDRCRKKRLKKRT